MEFITLEEINDLHETKDHNRYNLKALWHNLKIAIHGILPEVDGGTVEIDDRHYDLFGPAPDIQPKSEHYVVIISFVGGYSSRSEYLFSQSLNRDQSRQLTDDIYRRVRIDLRDSRGCHACNRLMDNILSEWGGGLIGPDVLIGLLRRHLTTTIEGHRISIERSRSKQRIRTYVYICIDDKRVVRFKGGWHTHTKQPRWEIKDIGDAVSALMKRIYK